VLETLAAESGGFAFQPQSAAQLDQVYDRVAAELHTQYLLEYYSDGRGATVLSKNCAVMIPERPNCTFVHDKILSGRCPAAEARV